MDLVLSKSALFVSSSYSKITAKLTMRDIPFNVSARTARLIGRENVSSAEGALIELVKNSYDADARHCIVCFDDLYAEVPLLVDRDGIDDLIEILKGVADPHQYYKFNDIAQLYELDRAAYDSQLSGKKLLVEEALARSVTVNIIDDGDGMTEEVIETQWMTIGTNNKHVDFLSSVTGRVKSGAKGIGRFALDRLGEKCDLLTKTEDRPDTLLWKVDWGNFDKQGITIDGVNAQLGLSDKSISKNLLELLSKPQLELLDSKLDTKGTHIRISNVRDRWGKSEVSKIFSELESLVPPVEAGDFKIYVFSRRYEQDFGEVFSSACEDFDCKLSARMNADGGIAFELIRKEIEPSKLSSDLLSRNFFLNRRYFKDKLCGDVFKYNKTLYELLPGLSASNNRAHESIGAFDFTLYFLKRTSDKKDAEIYLHRNVNSDGRKRWLDHNNGIRIFRDNFRVRPYGEIGKPSWDWLGLGRRQAEDPSALRSGRWKVTPNNISGVINISRLSNLGLQDKSSREGIQENDTFTLFRSVIEAIVKEFEADRSSLYREIYLFQQEKKSTPTDEELNPVQEEDAEKIAQKIFDDIKKDHKEPNDDSTKLALALLKVKAKAREADDRLEEMKKENSLLRVFASSGITIASFTHELDSLNAKLGNRFDRLESLIRAFVEMTASDRALLGEMKDPYKRIEILKRDDERVKNWIKYSLRTIRKDKRRRVKITLRNYLENLRDEWLATLAERQITIDVNVSNAMLSVRAYEIDLDCIFNNLIINSADAFKRPGFSGARKISISAESIKGKVAFKYEDSGPGLSKDIQDPLDIFKPTFTTKTNSVGEEIGTGLGMWLVSKTIEEYGGNAKLILGAGFSLILEMKGE